MITDEITEALTRYIEHGIPTGGFLRCVLQNDLFGAVGHADTNNQERLTDIVFYIEQHLPPSSYGSKETVSSWLRHFTRLMPDSSATPDR